MPEHRGCGIGSDHPASRQGEVGDSKLRDLTELLVLLGEVVHEHFLCWTEPAPSAGSLCGQGTCPAKEMLELVSITSLRVLNPPPSLHRHFPNHKDLGGFTFYS